MTERIELGLSAQDRVALGVLAELTFPDGEVLRVWNGTDRLETSDGRVWLPVGHFGLVDEIESAAGLEWTSLRMGLALPGAPTNDAEAFAAAVRAARDRPVYGGTATLYLQDFDPVGWQLLGAPQAEWSGVMVAIEDAWSGVEGVRIELALEHWLAASSGGAGGWRTDSDQRARHAGDRYYDILPAIPDRVVTWPRD